MQVKVYKKIIIQQQNMSRYEDALQMCKEVLKIDNNNEDILKLKAMTLACL